MNRYLPEGMALHTPENKDYITAHGLSKAMAENRIIEAPAIVCTTDHDLNVRLGDSIGVIPRDMAALGITEGVTRDIAIISRVGKPVCFKVHSTEPEILLSRRDAQEEALSWFIENLHPGDILPCVVTHTAAFGAFVDIGCGIIGLIGIENLSVSRISHSSDRVFAGQHIFAAVLTVDKDARRITLTHKELLGTWQENADMFQTGETVSGIVRGKKEYGLFVELTPNLSGLAEYRDDINEGDCVSVYIKSIIPEKMKIKLIIIDKTDGPSKQRELKYFHTSGSLNHWNYCTEESGRTVPGTVFY